VNLTFPITITDPARYFSLQSREYNAGVVVETTNPASVFS